MREKTQNSSLLSKWKNRETKTSVAPVIPKAPEGALIPLSSGQQRLWFLQQLYPENPFYNYSEALVFKGNLSPEYLKRSLRQLFIENEVLRSSYPVMAGKPTLMVSDMIPELIELDITDRDEESADLVIEKAMREQSTTIFNLAKPALVRLSLFKKRADYHVLFITMHHIIIDEWSIGILKEQLAANYIKISQGQDLVATNKIVRFSDYAYWERNKTVDLKKLTYWKSVLSNEVPILNLQTDKTRPATPLFRGKQRTQQLSFELSSEVFSASRKMETTPFVFLLGVYYILLQRYSGQDDILVGTPVSNRSVTSLERVVGFFIDTLVLRNTVDNDVSFSEFLRQVKTNTLEAFSNKDVPFDVLVKELNVERSLSMNPLFQVMFLYHSESKAPSFGDELRLVDHAEFDTEVAKFDLTLSISESQGRLFLTFEYDTDLFAEQTIERFLVHYKNLLEGVVKSPDMRLDQIQMLTDKEKTFLVQKPTTERTYFSSYDGIHNIIEDVCRMNPSKRAVTFENDTLTYAELDSRAKTLALSILKNTKGKSEIVALCLDRSIHMLVALYGILKAGCAYLPIDPKYPVDRLNYVLKDAGCVTVVSSSSLHHLFEKRQTKTILIDDLSRTDSAPEISLPEVRGEDTAYVIYTSGSTGKPKGVPISHKNIINSTAGRLAFYSKNPTAFLLMSSISFDSSKAGIFWTLCTGGHLVISENRIEQDINRLVGLIARHEISHTLMLPSLYELVLEHGDLAQLTSLKTVIVAGEACKVSLGKKHFESLSGVALYNEYGPTEASVWCIAHRISKSDLDGGVIPIGGEVANAKIYILNERLGLVPPGAVGEIYVGGPGLTSGYINKPELSEKVLLSNPYGDGANAKIYKTGDLGRFRADGQIEFLGRADHQVKIRGFRIELEEVEKAVLANSSANAAVAMVENISSENDSFEFDEFADTDAMVDFIRQHLSDEELESLMTSIESIHEDQ